MGQIVIYLLMVQKLSNLTQKISEIAANPLRLGNISKDFFLDNMKKTGLIGSLYDFGFDNDAIANDDILETHKYLAKRNGIV